MPLFDTSIYLQTANGTKYYPRDPARVEEYLTSRRMPSSFVGKANSYIASRSSPGRGWLLLRRQDLEAIDRAVTTHKIVFVEGTRSVTISNLHIYSAVGVTTSVNQRADEIYLVELRDNRELVQHTSISKSYNVRTPDWVSNSTYLTASLSGGTTAWTWTTLVEDIWTNITTLGGALTKTSASWPSTAPSGFQLYGSAFKSLEHICEHTHNLLFVKRDGTFHIVTKGNADATNQALLSSAPALNPSDPYSSDSVTVPASVKVFFTRRDPAFQGSTDPAVLTAAEKFHSEPAYTVTVTSTAVVPALTGTITGATATLFDSMEALYNELGTIQNAAALTTQAEARATAYINSLRQGENRNDIFRGPIEFEVGPSFTEVHWYDFGDGIRTQTIFSPKERPGAGDNAITEFPGIADLARWHLPLERFVLGEVYNADIEPNGKGTVRVQYGTQTSSTVTTWADTSLPHEITAWDIYDQTYSVGQRVVCMYHRQTSRWIIVNDLGILGIIRFELTGTLAISGHASAKLMKVTDIATGEWEEVTPVVEIEVYDPYPDAGMWNGISGYQGLAVPRNQYFTDTTPDPDEDRLAYDIIWMERIAQQIRGTTTEYIGASVAGRVSVGVDWFDHQGRDPGSTINCYDPNNLFPATFSGAEVLAEYNNKNERYELIQAQQVARFATALLTADLCASGTASIDTFAVIPQSLDVGSPGTTPTSVNNSRGHAGKDNDAVLLIRTSNVPNNPSWDIVDISLHSVAVITTVEISGGNLQSKTKTIYVEQCSNTESSPTTISTTTTSCP